MDENGTLLPGGQAGQIVVRGTIVMDGYDGDPIATQNAFADGWLKTGDLGFFDEDGYLFITGRSREFINRGGEKISPLEVDAVLLEYPAVAEAVTFAVPHPTLGEDVAAAIVLSAPRHSDAAGYSSVCCGACCRFQGSSASADCQQGAKRTDRQSAAYWSCGKTGH